MVTKVINGFLKVSEQDLSYDFSKFFFEELKRLSPPKLRNIFKEINMHRLSYRVSDCQVGIPYVKAGVFKATGEFSTPIELGKSPILFHRNNYLTRNYPYILVHNYNQ